MYIDDILWSLISAWQASEAVSHVCRLSAAPSQGGRPLRGAGWVEVSLKEVIDRRRISGTWNLKDVPQGQIRMELQWLPILEGVV